MLRERLACLLLRLVIVAFERRGAGERYVVSLRFPFFLGRGGRRGIRSWGEGRRLKKSCIGMEVGGCCVSIF